MSLFATPACFRCGDRPAALAPVSNDDSKLWACATCMPVLETLGYVQVGAFEGES